MRLLQHTLQRAKGYLLSRMNEHTPNEIEAGEFPQVNLRVAEDQPQYKTLPVCRLVNDADGTIVCRWKLTWRQRIYVLLTGEFWQLRVTFKQPMQPESMLVKDPFTPISNKESK